MKKIGLYGGTFNPIHLGHTKIALLAQAKMQLDEIIFIPAGDPPHKTKKKLADKQDRFNMVELAIKDYECFSVSDYEIKLNEKSYSLNLIRHFKKLYPEDELYFIIGADSLYDLPKWYHYEELMNECSFIVISRPGFDNKKLLDCFSGNEKPPRLFFVDNIFIDISSTEIRDRLKKGKSTENMISNAVEKYITEHKLYN